MSTKRLSGLLIALLCGLILGGAVLAQSSSHYRLAWNVAGGFGGGAHSSHYALNGTGGQGVAGAASSAHYRIGGGFWYGLGRPALQGYRVHLPSLLK